MRRTLCRFRALASVRLISAIAIVGAGAAVTASAAVSSGSGAAVAGKSTPPANTLAPTIGGTAKQNQVLTASAGTWSGTTPITYAYQWLRCKAASALANGDFESGTSGWTGTNGGTIARSTAQAHGGGASLQVVTPGGSANVEGAQFPTASGPIK